MSEIKWTDKQQTLKAVKKNGLVLEFAPEELKNNKEIVIAAVTQYGYALEFASEELKNDKDIVLAAVKQDGIALKFASKELKNDKEVVLTAANQNGIILPYASKELQNDLGLLKVLKNYHMSRSINYYNEEYKNWYKERMTVLDIFNEQLYLEKNISTSLVKSKTRKF